MSRGYLGGRRQARKHYAWGRADRKRKAASRRRSLERSGGVRGSASGAVWLPPTQARTGANGGGGGGGSDALWVLVLLGMGALVFWRAFVALIESPATWGCAAVVTVGVVWRWSVTFRARSRERGQVAQARAMTVLALEEQARALEVTPRRDGERLEDFEYRVWRADPANDGLTDYGMIFHEEGMVGPV